MFRDGFKLYTDPCKLKTEIMSDIHNMIKEFSHPLNRFAGEP